MTDKHVASCFCGAVTIEVTGAPLEMGYCHCNSCRSHSGSPISSYMLWKAEDVRVTKGTELVGRFSKTPMSDRHFCKRCGGHFMTIHPTLGLTDVRAPLITGITFRPTVHLHYAESVLPIKDGLPKLKDFPAAIGGSGDVIPE